MHMLWTDCLTRLRQELSDNVFAMWIRPLVAEELTVYVYMHLIHIGHVIFKTSSRVDFNFAEQFLKVEYVS
jgi:chromosomal replication initiation ATPase DnaA